MCVQERLGALCPVGSSGEPGLGRAGVRALTHLQGSPLPRGYGNTGLGLLGLLRTSWLRVLPGQGVQG